MDEIGLKFTKQEATVLAASMTRFLTEAGALGHIDTSDPYLDILSQWSVELREAGYGVSPVEVARMLPFILAKLVTNTEDLTQ